MPYIGRNKFIDADNHSLSVGEVKHFEIPEILISTIDENDQTEKHTEVRLTLKDALTLIGVLNDMVTDISIRYGERIK